MVTIASHSDGWRMRKEVPGLINTWEIVFPLVVFSMVKFAAGKNVVDEVGAGTFIGKVGAEACVGKKGSAMGAAGARGCCWAGNGNNDLLSARVLIFGKVGFDGK